MASIAIGDIHGNVAALGDLLAQIGPTLTSQDTVVFLGDYIDRGAQSAQVVDRILSLRRESPATVVTLKGNHGGRYLRRRRMGRSVLAYLDEARSRVSRAKS